MIIGYIGLLAVALLAVNYLTPYPFILLKLSSWELATALIIGITLAFAVGVAWYLQRRERLQGQLQTDYMLKHTAWYTQQAAHQQKRIFGHSSISLYNQYTLEETRPLKIAQSPALTTPEDTPISSNVQASLEDTASLDPTPLGHSLEQTQPTILADTQASSTVMDNSVNPPFSVPADASPRHAQPPSLPL